jgi:hypothetical protein
MDEQRREQNERGGGGFPFGWVIFLLVIFGGPLLRWLQSAWARFAAPGGPGLSPDVLLWVGGGVLVAVLVIYSLVALNNMGGPSSPGTPTTVGRRVPVPPASRPPIPPPSSGPRMPPSSNVPEPSVRGLPPPRVPNGPPKFEPIIEPGVLVFAIIALILALGASLIFSNPSLLGPGFAP